MLTRNLFAIAKFLSFSKESPFKAALIVAKIVKTYAAQFLSSIAGGCVMPVLSKTTC